MSRTIAFSTIVVLISTMALTSIGCRHCQNCHDAGGPVYMGGAPTTAHDGQRAGSIFAPAGGRPQNGMIVDSGPIIADGGMVIGASSMNAGPPIQGFSAPPVGGMSNLSFDQMPREGEIQILSDEVTIPATIPQTPVIESEGPERISTPSPRTVTAATPVPMTTTSPGAWSSVPETPPFQPIEQEPVVALESEDAPRLLR